MPTVTPAHNNPKPNSDEEYQNWGVTPPEHQEFDVAALTPKPHQHDWVQQGNFLHCNAGSHGRPIDHMKEMFVGVDAMGNPILKPISTTDADARVKKYKAAEKRAAKANP